MDSKRAILDKLSSTPSLVLDSPESDFLHVVPNVSNNPEEMLTRFITEAEKLICKIHQVTDEEEAIEEILTLVEGEEKILGWSLDEIGLPSLEPALNAKNIHVDTSPNPEARYGVTGVDAALAATGSIILSSGAGKPRVASLLPLVHIAVLRSEKIIQDLESWVAHQENLTEPSNIFVISGPSKTADIAMELVMGMHGPQEIHIILIET
jgi:L-lactate dehydrogenase complex protein LldG